MKKGSERQVSGTMISIIIVLAGFFVWLYVSGSMVTLLEDLGFGGACKLGVLAQSVAKSSKGIIPEIPAKCKTNRITISASELYDTQKMARTAIPEATEKELLQWGLQKRVADQMVDCYEKGWRGELPLKSIGLFELPNAGDYVCLVCARIRFDEPVQRMFPAFGVSTDWLKNNKYRGESYYKFLTDGVHPQMQKFPTMSSFSTKAPMAVVFVAGTVGKADTVGGAVGLFPYAGLTTNLGFEVTQSYPIQLYPIVTGVSVTMNPTPHCIQIIGD